MPVITVQVTSRTSEQARQPLLHRLCKDYNVVTNIRRAQVTDDYAFVELDIEGSLEEVQRAIAFLHTTGLNVDARERSVGDNTNL